MFQLPLREYAPHVRITVSPGETQHWRDRPKSTERVRPRT